MKHKANGVKMKGKKIMMASPLSPSTTSSTATTPTTNTKFSHGF
jgi:hypothetical protein